MIVIGDNRFSVLPLFTNGRNPEDLVDFLVPTRISRMGSCCRGYAVGPLLLREVVAKRRG